MVVLFCGESPSLREFIDETNASVKNGKAILRRQYDREWAGKMPKGAKIDASGRSIDEFLSLPSVKHALEIRGISKTAMKAEMGKELDGKGGWPAFKAMSRSEQQELKSIVLERFKYKRGTHGASQSEIDELVDGLLGGILFTSRPIYNSRIATPGKTTIKTVGDGRRVAIVEIGKQYKAGKKELIDSILHEELEARIALNRKASIKIAEINGASDAERHRYIQRIIDRYIRIRGIDDNSK